jgi:hypothetical protein
MYVDKGDEVILTETDQPQLRAYIGKKWRVEATMLNYHPSSAMISRGNLQASAFLKHLEVVPPEDSPFHHDETVKIRDHYDKVNAYSCNKKLIGKIGRVRGYDSRNSFYFVRCTTGEAGWFPVHSLIPLNFKGDRFYYPFEKVLFKGKEKIINQIKQSKFKWGQILMIDGEWIHASDVEPLDDK